MSGLKGDVTRLRKLEATLRTMPRVLGAKIAASVAPTLSAKLVTTFNAGQNAYGDPWLPGYDGKPVDLRESGALAASARLVAIGTKIRGALGPRYSKWVVNVRGVFPRGRMPKDWIDAVHATAGKVIAGELAKGGV